MTKARNKRSSKQQLGQFFTPPAITQPIVDSVNITKDIRILEPGCGNGAFIIPLISKLIKLYTGTTQGRLDQILTKNIWAVELSADSYHACLNNIKAKFGYLPNKHNIVHYDFFEWQGNDFDLIIGNPPFGATIDESIEDALDKVYGWRNGHKIKKETYSFFLVKSIDHLKTNGQIKFICSDTFLTISTMKGLRKFLMDQGSSSIKTLDYFSDETNYPMVLLSFDKIGTTNSITLNDVSTKRESMDMLDNFSWTITDEDAKLFKHTLKEKMICSGGMTTGKNEYFVREIENGYITEPYRFEFVENVLRVIPQEPVKIKLPHPDYCFYNRSCSEVFAPNRSHVIYWKDDGKAVKTFKKNGNWYLHGVGGQKFFGREGITWNLISKNIKARYLPPGYILDNSAPCGFTDELYFILGWLNTDLATKLLKTYINHTKNIQGKDVERLPYPWWANKDECEKCVKAFNGDWKRLNELYEI